MSADDDLKPLSPEEFKRAQEQMKALIGIRDSLLQLSDVVKKIVPVLPEETVEPVQLILTTMIAEIVQKVRDLLSEKESQQ